MLTIMDPTDPPPDASETASAKAAATWRPARHRTRPRTPRRSTRMRSAAERLALEREKFDIQQNSKFEEMETCLQSLILLSMAVRRVLQKKWHLKHKKS